MRFKITISPTSGQLYLPTFLREQGFEGELEALGDSATIIVLRNGATAEQIRRSLRHLQEEMDEETQEEKP